MTNARLVLAVSFATALALGSTASAKKPEGAGGGKGRPGSGKVDMTNTGVDADARGVVDVKHFPAVGNRTERSWLRFKLGRLDASAAFTLWMDDPSTDADPALVQVADLTITTSDRGGANVRIDTKHGGVLPFGATLASLAGKAFELRSAGDVAVLTGTVPAAE